MRLVTCAQMRELDRRTIELGTPGRTLMERAGVGVADRVTKRFAAACRRGVLVVAGHGNNGGDGFVIARRLRAVGVRARVILLADRARVAGDARANLDRWVRARGALIEIAEGDPAPIVLRESERCGVIVDAVLGTGLSAEVRGLPAAAIAAINTVSSAPDPSTSGSGASDRTRRVPLVVAVDIPSGLDGDRGEPLGVAVRASATVTLGAVKTGLIIAAARSYVGDLDLVDIGIAEAAYEDLTPVLELGDASSLRALVPQRGEGGHKGTFGHLLLVAGSRGKTGAAILSARGALRGGVGLATVACPADAQPLIAGGAPELMTEIVKGVGVGGWRSLLRGKSAVVIGPGIGGAPPATRAVRWLASNAGVPAVIDADGLNALRGDLDLVRRARAPVVLTPHPGEMARLTGATVAEVQSDRLKRALEVAERARAVVVLKGSSTIVASPEGVATINSSGGPILGTGGTGDVLAGLIGSLLAQGVGAYDAARLGVYLHGRAGDRIAERIGDAGLLASQLADELPLARRELLGGLRSS